MKKHIRLVMFLVFSFYVMVVFPPPIHADDVTLTIGNGSGFPGSSNNSVQVSLDNPAHKVGGVQVDICDEGDYLTCNGCVTSGRTSGFDVLVTEQGDGCCFVLLYCTDPGCHIEGGSGPIAIIQYDVSTNAPAGECRDLNPGGAVVPDENGFSLGVESLPGKFCFKAATIPTTSEWGMIIFMTLILGIGVVALLRRV